MNTMTASQAGLWSAIKAFEIDEPGTSLTFAARLARENGWTRGYAARVVEEYRRFVFLAMTAGHPVTPSDQVDQAWHLHLTYTKSYWERMCTGVLPRPLHHNPTKGGAREDSKFCDWYMRTKESYERVFGEKPPADIWPETEVRFGDDLHHERINRVHYWVIPKRAARRWAVMGGLGATTVAGAGCSPMLLGLGMDGVMVGLLVFVVVIVVVVAAAGAKGKSTAPRRGRNEVASRNHGSDGWVWWWGGASPSRAESDHHRGGHDGHPRDDSAAGHQGDHGGSSVQDGSGSSDSGGGSSGCGSSGCGGGGCGGGGD